MKKEKQSGKRDRCMQNPDCERVPGGHDLEVSQGPVRRVQRHVGQDQTGQEFGGSSCRDP